MVCRELSPEKPFSDFYYFENNNAKSNAEKCWRLISNLNSQIDSNEDFGIFETRQHNTISYVCCWYVGFRKKDEKRVTLVLHFNILEKGEKEGIRVFFRLNDYAPKNRLKKVRKETEKSISISDCDYTETELVTLLNEYLKNLREEWEQAKEFLTKRKPCQNQRGKQK